MQTLKFETRVSKTGSIQLPKNSSLNDQDVEIVIFPKANNVFEKISPEKFIEKWAGFLNNSDTLKSKYEYLIEKYK